MRTSIRWWSRLAFVASLGVASLVACASDRPNQGGEEQRQGTLTLPLRTVSNTGSVYFLRNAFFQIVNLNTGEVTFLSTEDGLPEQSELVVRLPIGFYQITLFDGWFLERFGGGGGNGGTSGGGFGGQGPEGGAPDDVPGSGGVGGDGDEGGRAGKPGVAGSFTGGGRPSMGGSFTGGGGPIAGGSSGGATGSGGGEVVTNARLVSDPTQFFNITPQGEAFVNFSFRVGDDVIEFNKGNLHITFDVDDQPLCQPPADVTRVERVLLETNLDALAGIDLRSVFDALAESGGQAGDGSRLYQQIFDSYATAERGKLEGSAHCGDERTGGIPTLNGYPIRCDRVEAAHVDDQDAFFATAFVNRLDLAPQNGAHCGQQRMIFANTSGPGSKGFGRTFMIVEAQIPNPSPELGILGCRPLAQFWLDQDSIDDPKLRGARLRQAFLSGGAPGLEGFPAFYTAENLTVGSGQIRTNVFDDSPWTLREFKLAREPNGNLSAVPFPVAESPHGALWNENSPLPQGEACRASFLNALEGVLTSDLSLMSFVVDSACKDAESQNDFSQDYASQLFNSPRFQKEIQAKLDAVGSKLTPFEVANRARFAGSCIGCHNEAQFSSLGEGLFAPSSFDFPQVVEFQEPCGDDSNRRCFGTSTALKTVFLPGRLNALGRLVPVVPNPCNGSGGAGGSGAGGSSSTGGGFGTGGFAAAGKDGGPVPGPGPEPAPVVDIQLASADTPVEVLQEEDQQIRDAYGELTISGKSAKSTH